MLLYGQWSSDNKGQIFVSLRVWKFGMWGQYITFRLLRIRVLLLLPKYSYRVNYACDFNDYTYLKENIIIIMSWKIALNTWEVSVKNNRNNTKLQINQQPDKQHLFPLVLNIFSHMHTYIWTNKECHKFSSHIYYNTVDLYTLTSRYCIRYENICPIQ